MMKNLKRKSQEVREGEKNDGELVTRADGSTAFKVKTRKRRSAQEKTAAKEKSQRKKIVILSSVVIALLLLGIGYGFVVGYYNSGGFEKKFVASIQSSTGADVEVSSVGVGLSESSVKSLSLSWGGNNSVVKKLSAQGLSADTGSLGLLTSGWSGSEVNVSKVDLELGYTESNSSGSTEERAFNYDIFLSNSTNIKIGESGEWLLTNTSASYKLNESGESQIDLYGGEFVTPIDLDYKLSTGVVTLKDSYMDLSMKLASNKTQGSVLLEGKVGYGTGDKISLKSTYQEAPLKDWLNIKMQRFIAGEITAATGSLRMNLGEEESIELVINAESEEMSLGRFPFVRTLSLELKDDYFVIPKFEDGSSFKLQQSNKMTKVSEISLLQEAHLKVTGEFSLAADGKLSGQLKLGIPVMNMGLLDKKVIQSVFSEDDGLFFWATVNISGTASIPEDDLGAQIIRARKASILEQGSDAEKFKMLTE